MRTRLFCRGPGCGVSCGLWLGLAVALCACRSGGVAARPAAESAVPDRNAVVARLDGEAIHAGEVDDTVRGGLIRADVEYRETVHKLRTQALDDLINERLVAKKAKAEGLTSDAYLDREVGKKITPPTDSELHALYDQAKQGGEDLPPFEVIRPQIVTFVHDRKMQQGLEELHTRLREGAKIEALLPKLELPRIAVDAHGPARGGSAAPVTIVAFSDYECPFCKRAEPAVKSILEAYGDKVRVVFREFPLPNHPHAHKAAEAALCAEDQGKYWEMNEKLFANQTALEVSNLKEYAHAVGLEQQAFDSCLDGGGKAEAIAASVKAGDAAGVAGTPSFFVNGLPITGVPSFERFKEVIDAELAGGGK